MITITVSLDEDKIREIVAQYLNRRYNTSFVGKDLPIQVRSKQNYHAEWEEAEIRISAEVLSNDDEYCERR